MSAQPTVKVLPPRCLLCEAPQVTWNWRAMPSEFGVVYLCDACCDRLGPAIAHKIALCFLSLVTTPATSPRDPSRPAPPVPHDGAS